MIYNGHGFKVGVFFDQRFPLYLGNKVIDAWGRIMILMVRCWFFFKAYTPFI